MKTDNNTILITGGGSGIGFQIAKLFSQTGNQVIITGRNGDKLQKAAAQLKNVTPIVADVTKPEDIATLTVSLQKDFPKLNIIINNAGAVKLHDLAGNDLKGFEKASEEMTTNYLSIIRLNEYLLPLLKQQTEAAIINVSSIVAFVPSNIMATYSASKAALHSYTQSLRIVLAQTTKVKVFELMPPLVDTEFSAEIGGSSGVHPSVVAEALLDALKKDEYEVHVGMTANMFNLFHASPAEAFKAMNSNLVH